MQCATFQTAQPQERLYTLKIKCFFQVTHTADDRGACSLSLSSGWTKITKHHTYEKSLYHPHQRPTVQFNQGTTSLTDAS